MTAKLSRKFYDRFGDDVANELVEWFNQVDATYRTDLRELNELNFARFVAKVEQRFAEADAKLERRFAEYDVKVERRFAEYDVKLERRFADYDVKLEGRFAEYDVKLEQRFAQVDVRFARLKSELLLWMFLFWATNLAALVGLARLKP